MLIKKWDSLPKHMQCDEIKPYYNELKERQGHLIMKRIFDIICSLCMLIVLSPVFFILIIWIRLDSHGKAFYRQERITQYGRTFKIFKFRTMVSNADKMGSLVTTKNDLRITRVGLKIRKCRLDELPQLINILIGDMTFVGTRPEVEKYVNAYTNEMKATLLLPAGVTSLASIKFKDEDEILKLELEKGREIDEIYIDSVLPLKMEFNLEAMHQVGVLFDIKTCLNTIIKV